MGWESPMRQKNLSDNEILAHVISTLTDDEYQMRGEYSSIHTPITVFHSECKCEFLVKPFLFLGMNVRCKCMYKHFKLNKKYLEKIKRIPTGLEIIEMRGYYDPCTIHCKKCGVFFTLKRFGHFLERPVCRRCNQLRNNVKDKEFPKKMKCLVDDEYSLLDDYAGANVRVTFIHNKCGTKYKCTPNAFLYGSRCPKCHKKYSYQEFKKEIIKISNLNKKFL